METVSLHAVTVASDTARAAILIDSSARHEVPVLNLAADRSGVGPGRSVALVRALLDELDEHHIVLYVDGYDTMVNGSLLEVGERFVALDVDVLFAANYRSSLDEHVADQFPEPSVGARYLSSGCYIGYADSLKRLLKGKFSDDMDDLDVLSHAYLRSLSAGDDLRVALDHEAAIFQTMSDSGDKIVVADDGRILNQVSNTTPLVVHGNGDAVDRRRFTTLCASLGYSRAHVPFSPTGGNFDVVGPEIIVTDFLAPSECTSLIGLAEEYGEWTSMYGDKFPGQELRLRTLDINLFNRLEAHFAADVNLLIERNWWPMRMHGLRDAFIIKYTPDTQASLACHTDASLVSGLVKLNDDYEGGETWFPRQQFSTKYLPVGKLALWPGQVTHGHEGRAVTSGVKYALVIWTSRHQNDRNY